MGFAELEAQLKALIPDDLLVDNLSPVDLEFSPELWPEDAAIDFDECRRIQKEALIVRNEDRQKEVEADRNYLETIKQDYEEAKNDR